MYILYIWVYIDFGFIYLTTTPKPVLPSNHHHLVHLGYNKTKGYTRRVDFDLECFFEPMALQVYIFSVYFNLDFSSVCHSFLYHYIPPILCIRTNSVHFPVNVRLWELGVQVFRVSAVYICAAFDGWENSSKYT